MKDANLGEVYYRQSDVTDDFIKFEDEEEPDIEEFSVSLPSDPDYDIPSVSFDLT
jgi:hypothetical protein